MTDIESGALARSLLGEFAARRPLGAGSFIVTLYGDAIVPRGGLVWLGNVIAVCGQLGISETLVRTAVSRLVSAGHLIGVKEGRRSFYRLTEASRETFEAAAEIIYGGRKASRDGLWSLLVLASSSLDEGTHRLLASRGYGFLGSGVALRAGAADKADESLPGLRFEARQMGAAGRAELRELAVSAWSLDELSGRYRAFSRRFSPLLSVLQKSSGSHWDPELALALRLLLVHDFRHLVLDDPGLPPDLLPDSWAGPAVQTLFATLYRCLNAPAEAAIDAAFVDAAGSLSADRAILRRRQNALAAISNGQGKRAS